MERGVEGKGKEGEHSPGQSEDSKNGTSTRLKKVDM